jgi:hypothetical protein
VLLFGLPFLHRSRVGGGSAVWRESSLAQGGLLRFLEFTGFSLPERAAGLNRLGFIREMSRFEDGAAESIYFGLMTSSPEESAEEAKKALESHAKEVVYSAIEGRVAPDAVETIGAHFTAPAQWSVHNRDELIQGARSALAEASPKPPEATISPATFRATGSATFLQSLADMLRDPNRTETRYVYNGHLYHLHVTRSEDPKATASFRERGLISANAEAVRANGQLRREVGGKEQNFRLWFEAGAGMPIPLRIEYQAKSYLRLVFEAEA